MPDDDRLAAACARLASEKGWPAAERERLGACLSNRERNVVQAKAFRPNNRGRHKLPASDRDTGIYFMPRITQTGS